MANDEFRETLNESLTVKLEVPVNPVEKFWNNFFFRNGDVLLSGPRAVPWRFEDGLWSFGQQTMPNDEARRDLIEGCRSLFRNRQEIKPPTE